MDSSAEVTEPAVAHSQSEVETAYRFLTTLFAPDDCILFRPIETWTESGRKQSRVDYQNTIYRSQQHNLKMAVLMQLRLAERDRVNLFFGVCPRIGPNGRYDLAWQIRTVRALWADLDHTSVADALARVEQASLPLPSIVVNSGHGVHLYWLLDEPYQIHDAGDPLAVETEWTTTSQGKRKPRKYIVEGQEKIYLDQRQHVSRLSPQASLMQDVLAGIATAIGGDHTTDLARLLRLPGSFNRKDERNGSAPVPTELVECEPSRRYPLATFERFKTPAPETQRARQIEMMPLPQLRKNTSPSKADKLAELIAASGIAEAGTRSEADFGVCCYAIRQGIAKDEVWSLAANVGKFGEQGQRYFDVTWESAEYEVRADTFENLQKRSATKSHPFPAPRVVDQSEGGDDNGNRPTILVDPSTMPVADTLHEITNRLLEASHCFHRADQLVLIDDQKIFPILSAPELAGLLNQHVEFYFVAEDAGEYKPLPPAYANTWLNQHVERARLPVIRLFTHNPVFTDDWRLVAPGYDKSTAIYYAGAAVSARSDTKHVDALLHDFCFQSPADRTNYVGVLLTTLLMPRFIGSKPAILLNGNQPGLGKSILAQIIAILRDGRPAETASYNPNDEEFEKRLGAIVHSGATTIIIDNAKARGRRGSIDSPCLERSITDPVLSFRLLGHSASIRAENSHLFCITANTPDVSRDLVTRSIVINLYHEGDPARRRFTIADPEEYAREHRTELLGELIGMVERWKALGSPRVEAHSRFNKRGWANIVGGILEACGEPDFLANAEEAAAQLDETRREFSELISVLADHPRGVWVASELVELCGKHGLLSADLSDGSPRSLATKMGTLAGRFVAERFPLVDGRQAVFHRTTDRKGNIYRVYIEDKVPNLEPVAEPLPNLVRG